MEATPARTVFAFAVLYLVWGSTYLAIRFALETLPGFAMAGVRFLVAGGLVYAWARVRGTPVPTRREWRSAAIVGALLLLGGNGAVVWAERTVPSGPAALLVATMPLWVVLLEWGRSGGSRPGIAVLVGLVLGFAGVGILIDPIGAVRGGAIDPAGAFVLVLGSLSWSVGSALAPRLELPKSMLLGTAMEMIAGGVLLTLLAAVTGELAQVNLATASFRSIGALLYLIVFGSILAFNAFVYLLKAAPPARVATYAYVNPVVAVGLGWLLANEPIDARMIAATGIIVAAVAMVTFGRSTPRDLPVVEDVDAAASPG
jgi:drug/metabolite transporter (DMT)-like permease